MTDEELARLKVWAQRRDPDHPSFGLHRYLYRCPLCRSESTDPRDGPGRHDVALALVEEVERLRTIVAVLTTEDPPCTGWDRAYFGGPVLDADGVALADQAVLLMEPCAHAHGPGYWEAMAGRDG